MVVSIRMTEEEKQLVESYAKINGLTLTDAIKKAILERIEEDFDIALFDNAFREYKKNPKTYSLEDIKKEFDL